jgi:hypothetical protein
MKQNAETTALVVEDTAEDARAELLAAVSTLVPSVVFEDREQVKKELPNLLGTILALCWINEELAGWFLDDAEFFLNRIGVFLPDDVSIEPTREARAKPSLTVFEQLEHSRYKRKIFKLSLRLIANR